MDLKSVIERNFVNDPLRGALERVLSFVQRATVDELRVVTLNQISEITSIPLYEGSLIRLSSIVCSRDLPLLELKFFYNVGEDDYRISDSEIAEAKATGFLVDPQTGNKDHEYEKHLFPFFQASKEIINAKNGN